MPVASPFSLVSAADSYSGAAWKDLYTVPVGKQAFVKSVIASNTSGNSTVTPALQLVKGATQAQLASPSLAGGAATNLLAGTLVMSAGDKLQQKTANNYLRLVDPVYPGLLAEPRVTNPYWNGMDRLNGTVFLYGYSSGGTDPYNSCLFTSADGNTWTWRDFNTSETTARSIYCACYGGGVYVLGSDAGIIFTSTDLVNWTKRTTSISGNIYSIAYGGSKFIAAGTGTDAYNCLSTSTDGISWSAMTTLAPGCTVPQITYDSVIGMFAIAPKNDGSNYVWTSTNGAAWTQRYSAAAISGVQSIGGKFVAITVSGASPVVSVDGINFYNYNVQAAYARGNPNCLKVANGRMFAINGSAVSVSSDGVNWDVLQSTVMYNGGFAVFDGSKYLLAPNATGGGELYKLSDVSKAGSQACSFTASIIEVAA